MVGLRAQAKLLLGRLEVIGPGAVNNNVFPPGGQQISQDCRLGGGEGGLCQQQRFFHQGGGTPNPIVLWKEADG